MLINEEFNKYFDNIENKYIIDEASVAGIASPALPLQGTLRHEYLGRQDVESDSYYYKNDEEITNHDITDTELSSYLSESSSSKFSKEKLYPVYIVNLNYKSPLEIPIRLATGSIYNHSLISLDATMNNMYSYNLHFENKHFVGFAREHIKDHIKKDHNVKMFINAFFLKKKHFDKLRSIINNYKKNVDKTSYNFIRLFQILFNNDKDGNDFSLVCSEFVATVIGMLGINVTKDKKSRHLTAPRDLVEGYDDVKVFHIYEGLARDYNPNKILGKLRTMRFNKNIAYLESGNLLSDNFLLEDDKKNTIKYKDLSNSIVLGNNRIHTSPEGYQYIKLNDNEKDDEVKKQLALNYINDKLYITSDLHLNHKNRNSANFKNLIINEINSKVPMNGAIMFLGDMGKKDDTTQKQYIKDFISKINCAIKILVLGNHDILSLADWYDCGFTYVTDRIETAKYVFTHYPVPVNNKINFHGHIHEEKEYWNVKPKNHINCYIGNHDYKVLTLRQYLNRFKQGKYKGKYVYKPEFIKDKISLEDDNNLNESSDESHLSKNYKSKKYIKLSSLKKFSITDFSLKKYLRNDDVLDFNKLIEFSRKYNGKGYVYIDKTKIVGYVLVSEGYICPLYIYPEYRGHGLSDQILDVAINELDANTLWVYKDNEIAIRLYENHGFEIIYEDDEVYKMKLKNKPNSNLNEDMIILNESNLVYKVVEFNLGTVMLSTQQYVNASKLIKAEIKRSKNAHEAISNLNKLKSKLKRATTYRMKHGNIVPFVDKAIKKKLFDSELKKVDTYIEKIKSGEIHF